MSMRTPLSRVRGLGATKSGVGHFWHQRVTAVVLLPLTLWFVWAVARYTGAEQFEVAHFLANPFNAALMLLFVCAGLYHMVLGVQVIIEDYLHREATKLALLILLQFAAFAVGAMCVIAVLRLAL